MPGTKPRNARKPTRIPGAAGATADGRAAAVHALMNEAEGLYLRKHYRKAIAACQKLAKLDPSNATPELMIEGCQREIRRRRAFALGVGAAVALAATGIALVYMQLKHLGIQPRPGTLVQLREREPRVFCFSSTFGRHKALEYTWALLDADGEPAPASEDGTLSQPTESPWECSYTPPHSLVLAAAGGKPVIRKLVASGIAASGKAEFHAEWTIEVTDVPNAPRIVSTDPGTAGLVCLVAGAAPRTFRVEAADGDGGKDLAYEWFVGKEVVHKGFEPTWTYRPPADALPPGVTGREATADPPLVVACRISNRFGEPMPMTAKWKVRLVRSNAPPQLIAFEPELSDLICIKEGESRTITAKVYDPEDPATLTYAWELGGREVSRSLSCTLSFPDWTTDSEKRFHLRFTVTDPCGAKAERSWQIVVVDVPRPATPP